MDVTHGIIEKDQTLMFYCLLMGGKQKCGG